MTQTNISQTPAPVMSVTLPDWVQITLATTAALAALLGYLSAFGTTDVVRFGMLLAVTLSLGGAIGFAVGKIREVAFWTGIGTAFGYLVVVHGVLYDWTASYAWPLVGGIVGATASLWREGKVVQRTLCCTLVALMLIAVYAFSLFGVREDLLADLNCAAFGGALMGLGVELIMQLEKRAAFLRPWLAPAITLAAIAGHWLATRYIPGI